MATKRAELIEFGIFMGRNITDWGSGRLADTCEALTKASAAAHNLGVRMCNDPAPANDPEWEKAQERTRKRIKNIAEEVNATEEGVTRSRPRLKFALSWDPRGACLKIAFGGVDPDERGYAVPCMSSR